MTVHQRNNINWLSVGVALALVTMGLNLVAKVGLPHSIKMWLYALSNVTGFFALLPLVRGRSGTSDSQSGESKWEQFAILTRWWLLAYCIVMLLVRTYLAFRLYTFQKEFGLLIR